MNKKLIIKPDPWREMITSAELAFPNECCGFFLGEIKDDVTTVQSVIDVINSARTDKHLFFEISPANYMAAEGYAEQYKISLLGIYHSHPNQSAYPSHHDLKSALPNFYYIILGLKNQEVAEIRCWHLDENEQFLEQQIEPLLSN